MSKSRKNAQPISEESMYLGLGIASLAKYQVENFLTFLVKEGKIFTKDHSKIRKQLTRSGEKEYKKLKKLMEKSLLAASQKIEATAHKVGGKKPEKKKK